MQTTFYLSRSLLSATLTSGLILTTGLDSSPAVEFKSPGDSAPTTSVGGGARGNVQFATPGDRTPSNSVGGGSRGNVQFGTPGDRAPSNSVGGGSRGDVQFGTPGDRAPSNSVGGGSRGDVQFGTPGDRAPSNSVGGGSRGNVQFGTPGDRAPSDSAGGATRSEAPPAMTAVIPPTKVGRTMSARPTFFVYLPPTLSKEAFFSLQDEQGNTHYQTRLKISGQGGIVSVTLPENATGLEIGKNYMWVFAPIPPDGILRPDNYVVTGWVKRVEATGNTASSPLEQATALAQAGIWYDTLSVLAAAKRSQPNNSNLVKEWRELLEQVGLNAIATQPLSEQL
jgi:Domain of Unknown Function (DUF928)